MNLYATAKPALRDALAHHLPGRDETAPCARQRAAAELNAAMADACAQQANTHPPRLRTHDRFGHRIDRVEFHPSYHALMAERSAPGCTAPWSLGPGAHIERAAAFMLFTELEPSVLCPISMTYAVTPALRANAAITEAGVPQLAASAYDPRLRSRGDKPGVTMGMGMTEKQGGSDVRPTPPGPSATRRRRLGRRLRVTGHKWFSRRRCAMPSWSLAQAGGLSCFFPPRCCPTDAQRARDQRLKDKLGKTRQRQLRGRVPTARHRLARRRGGRGVPQILEMGTLTRLDCALGTSGLMRQALAIA